MDNQYDAIVIGAGVIGTATALELARAGWKTLSIDKLPEAGYGSTSGSCAIIRTYYSAYETCALAYEGWHYWSRWEDFIGVKDEAGMAEYHNTGCLVVKTEHNHHLSKVCATMDALGCEYTEVDTSDMKQYLPGCDTSSYHPAKLIADEEFGKPTGAAIEGCVFFPNGGYVNDPKLSAHNLQRAAEHHGATFLFNTAVTKINKAGGRISGVDCDNGKQYASPVVINVAGPHSSKLNEMAGVAASMKMSTRALRHEVAHVKAPAGFNTANGIISSDSDIHAYTRPEKGDNLLIGSEDPECDVREWVDDPDNFSLEFSAQWKTLVMRLAQRLPDLGIPDTASGVVALYDVSEDWMPIYDKSDVPGFYMACGTSGNQYKNAPVAGKIMAALVQACEAGHDHDNDPLPFTLEHIDATISLGFFSRNREINQDSSFSVIG